jgi:8-oxo-dGTP diphosphatase
MTVVVAAVIEQDGRILVCRRRADQPHPCKWEFPGGKVEPGETAPEALRRELLEELAIHAEAGPEISRYTFQYPGKSPILLIFYAVREYTGQLQNRVFDGVEWAARADLPLYDFLEGDVEFVARLAQGAPT